jgi:hypothetical protein
MKGQRQAQRQRDFNLNPKTPMSFKLLYTLGTDYGNPNNMNYGDFRSCGSFIIIIIIIIMYAGFSL